MKLKLFLILGLSVSTLSLSSCATVNRTAQRPGATPVPYQGQNIIETSPVPGRVLRTSPSPNITFATPTPMPGQTTQPMAADTTRSDNIRRQLTQMREITQPHVVVIGNTALVGYTISPGTRDATATKNMVINKVKQIDPSITTVASSDAGDIVPQISQLSTDVMNKRPADEIGNRFNTLVKRLIPTVR